MPDSDWAIQLIVLALIVPLVIVWRLLYVRFKKHLGTRTSYLVLIFCSLVMVLAYFLLVGLIGDLLPGDSKMVITLVAYMGILLTCIAGIPLSIIIAIIFLLYFLQGRKRKIK